MSLGKWILGGLGFAVGGPIGALIGVFIASMFDSSKDILNDNQSTRLPTMVAVVLLRVISVCQSSFFWPVLSKPMDVC